MSIISQNYPCLEYIIIDGGSTDGSVEIIRKYQNHITYWESTPDRGQADALNKGLQHATGDIFNWINADDILAEGALWNIASNWTPGHLLATTVVNFTCYNDISTHTRIENKNLLMMGLGTSSEIVTFHQPGLWSDCRLAKLIQFDVSLSFSFDMIYYIQYFARNPLLTYSSDVTVYFRVHRESKSVRDRAYFNDEKIKGLVGLISEASLPHSKRLLLVISCIQRLIIRENELSVELSILSRIVLRITNSIYLKCLTLASRLLVKSTLK